MYDDIELSDDVILGYLEVKGSNPVLITSSHSQGPDADYNTGEIAYRVASLTNSHGMICTFSRTQIDANRVEGRVLPYRKKIADIVTNSNIHYIFDIHGMKLTEYDIDFGTAGGKTATETLISSMIKTLISFGLDAKKDCNYLGLQNDLLLYHSNSPRIQGVQVEVSEPNRRVGSQLIVKGLCTMIYNIINRWDNR